MPMQITAAGGALVGALGAAVEAAVGAVWSAMGPIFTGAILEFSGISGRC